MWQRLFMFVVAVFVVPSTCYVNVQNILRQSSSYQLSELRTARDDNDRGAGLRKALTVLDDNNNKNGLQVGSTVVSNTDLPHLGIWKHQSYELRRIYDQGAEQGGATIQQIDVNSLEMDLSKSGYTRYISLYSTKHHQESGPVTLQPDEILLSSLRQEIRDSVLSALPLFAFWTALALSFANNYNVRYGGNFLDALFRT